MRKQTTANQIREKLNNAYHRKVPVYKYLMQTYDNKMRERRETDRLKKQLKREVCASCGQKKSDFWQLEAAHIEPLSECAKTTVDNLVLLCGLKQDAKSKRAGKLHGCHNLFDMGCCSIEEMRKVRCRWVLGLKPDLRSRMNRTFEQFEARQEAQGLIKEIDDLKEKQKPLNPTIKEWHHLQIRIAELERRRTRETALQEANSLLEEVAVDRLSKAWQSKFYYEKGYIELLSGNLKEAFKAFNTMRPQLSGWRLAAHTTMAAQVGLLMNYAKMSGSWSWHTIENRFSAALRRAQKEVRGPSIVGFDRDEERRCAKRWVQNSLLNLMQAAIALRKFKRAEHLWTQIEKNWHKMDLSSGWDVAFRPRHLFLYGKLQLAQHGPSKALPYLVRSLVRMIDLRGQPEGSRDILFTIAEALKQVGDVCYSKVQQVAKNCIDYSSWFHP